MRISHHRRQNMRGNRRASGGRASAPTLLDQMPAGAAWFVDGTVEGTADSDGNIVATSLVDQVGSAHLSTSATTSKRPRGIPADYLVNGRKSLLLDNDASNGAQQSFFDGTADRALWKPIIEVEASTGATLILSFIPRGGASDAQVFGNYAGNITTPGFYVLIDTDGVMDVAVWKSSALLINRATAAGAVPRGVRVTVAIIIRTDRTYSIRVNGAEVLSGSTLTTSTAVTLTNPVTIGTRSGADASNMWGGNFLCGALYHTALGTSDVEAAEDAIDAWYAVPAPAFDTGPLAGVSVLADVNLAILGTSIDTGANDAGGGYPEILRQDIEPTWSDLALTFVGESTTYTVGTTDVMAVGSLTVRGSATQNGFDSIADAYAFRMDTQLAAMDTAGVFDAGKPLVCTVPIGWINDIKNGPGLSLDRDRHGDLVRMLVRFVALVRGYDADCDIRFVLATCTPTNSTVSNLEIVLHNASVRSVATAIAAQTACPVVVADAYAPIAANVAGLLDDGLHPNTAGHEAIAPVIANGIRYVCGLSDAA